MKQQKIGVSFLLGFAALWGVALSGASCAAPEMLCEVGTGPYAVQYFPKDPAQDCLKLPGELVGMGAYSPPREDGTNTDASRFTIAIQANAMGGLEDEAAAIGAKDPDPAHVTYSLGDYSARPDADDFCAATNLAPAEQHIPETNYTDMEGNAATFPETRLTYAWRDVRLYMTFATPGNAATGEVTITREITDPASGAKDTCASTYVASALFPSVGCEKADAMGMGTGEPDDTRCCAKADPANGRPFGSGLHPDFRVKCDPALLVCVLDWKPGEPFPPLGQNAACGG